MTGNILIVDDDRDLGATLVSALRRRGLEVTWKSSAERALAALDEASWDVVVTDITMGAMSGLALCEELAARRPDLPVVLMTAHGTVESAVAALRAGARDFVIKPFDIDALLAALARAAGPGARAAPAAGPGDEHDDGMIGESPPMQAIRDLVQRVAGTEVTVLITGPSGTGKELVARALHARGRRSGRPFVPVNCAALPEPLLESELFGHARGAFTDARMARRGLFLQAQGGTLFLDEVSDLPLAVQPKLLRALQERAIRPVGGDKEEACDVRLITATNTDLEGEVAAQRFREDLFYRINVVRIELPPLCARGDDVVLLARHFVRLSAAMTGKRVRGLSAAAERRLCAYRWPGNVRELENVIASAVALSDSEELTLLDLPEKIRSDAPGESVPVPAAADPLLAMDEVERRHILRVLEAMGGSKALAAEVLGLDRSTLYRKLDRYNRSGPVAK